MNIDASWIVTNATISTAVVGFFLKIAKQSFKKELFEEIDQKYCTREHLDSKILSQIVNKENIHLHLSDYVKISDLDKRNKEYTKNLEFLFGQIKDQIVLMRSEFREDMQLLTQKVDDRLYGKKQ